MKYTMMGFSQKKAFDLELSIDELIILRWIVDFSQTGRMKVLVEDERLYYWINYKTILDDMPLLRIKKDTLYRKLKHMNEVGVLKHKCVRNKEGTFSYYGLGERYVELIDSRYEQKSYAEEYEEEGYGLKSVGCGLESEGVRTEIRGGTDFNPKGVRIKIPNKDTSTKLNQSTKDSSIKDNKKESIKEKEPVPPQQGTSSHNGTNNDSFKKIIPHKMNYGEFENVQLTDAELEKLKLRFSNWEERIENLSLYLASTGKKYKSHYATILNWARKDVNGTVKKGKDDLVVTDNQGNKINYAKAGTWL